MGIEEVCWEIVVSRARAGVGREQIVELGQKIQAWAKEQPGFLERQLVEDAEHGTWIDVVTWRTEADAKRAAGAMSSAPCAAAIGALLDEQSIAIFHGRAVSLEGAR